MSNIIGDVGGRFKELIRLIGKMPDDDIILVGDIIDVGNESNKVIEFARTNPNIRVIFGNHESFFLDYIDKTQIYEKDLWILKKGGKSTLDSYGYDSKGNPKIPKEHIDFIRSLSLYIETSNFLISHAPWSSLLTLEQACSNLNEENSIIWNRKEPILRNKFQIFGHLNQANKFSNFAMCIDDTRNKKLIGINTETMEIFQQPYFNSGRKYE